MSTFSAKIAKSMKPSKRASNQIQPGLEAVKKLITFFSLTDEERIRAGIIRGKERYDGIRMDYLRCADSDETRE
jgi:hypothetical protein